jgi:hypothetical protein
VYSAIEHLARTIWLGRFQWSNRMAMFSAYFDESGHPDDSNFLVVAGCVADLDQWVHLEREWCQALSPLDPLSAPGFHFAECRDDALKMRLAQIICRRVEKSFATVVPLDQYRVMNRKYIVAEALGYPYPLGARWCIGAVQDWAEYHSEPTPIEFVFEDGAKHKGQIEWLAERDRFPLPIYKKKSECRTLQVADLLAGEIRRVLDASLKTGSLLELLESAPHSWGIMDLKDADRLPFICKISPRDPSLRYQSKIMRHGPKRFPVVHSWGKDEKVPKLKKAVRLSSDDTPLTLEVADLRIREYENASPSKNKTT